jgi:hypothetical protein
MGFMDGGVLSSALGAQLAGLPAVGWFRWRRGDFKGGWWVSLASGRFHLRWGSSREVSWVVLSPAAECFRQCCGSFGRFHGQSVAFDSEAVTALLSETVENLY